ncbi:MAG: pantetheine-phosphate adenylyltransferase [Dehalococcoidales bacterium]|nr:pantetheine-phosphate adenylyltransferase [Dehalococcoidales bacterium]
MKLTNDPSKKIAVYAGTFDPVTLGHLWMIEQGAILFDTLIVAIGSNFEKKEFFSLEERISMLLESTQHLKNLQIDEFSGQFLIRYSESIGARFILRGIRNPNDYEYEKALRHLNSDLNPDITTIFLMPPREISEVSSSIVKGLVGSEGWETILGKYVPLCVIDKLKTAYEVRKREKNLRNNSPAYDLPFGHL